MKLLKENGLNKLIPSDGLILKLKDDNYIASYIDDSGEKIPEHLPVCSSIVYLPNSVTLERAQEIYEEKSMDGYPWKPEEHEETMDSIWKEAMLDGII